MTLLDRAVGVVESAEALDPISKALDTAIRPVVTGRWVRTLLSGTPFGHPAHPALVAVPIGSWVAVSSLDVFGDDQARRAGRHLALLGCAAAVPSAITGLSDWLDTEGAERRVGLVHASLNLTALALYATSARVRRKGSLGLGVALAGAGSVVVTAAGWLGGHLAYARGVGVDTTAFQVIAEDWTDVIAAQKVRSGQLTAATVAGVSVLFTRIEEQIVALDGRCTHRGGPLHEGSIDGTTITCPWHHSEFDATDGRVRCGPATRPQRVLDVRVVDGTVQVRRHVEHGTLRTNPVSG